MNTSDKTRIYGEDISINSSEVFDFWRNRSGRELPYAYNLVNFQDDHPDVVIERDGIEKNKITGFLNICEESMILDVGCGIGRWFDSLKKKISYGKYVGVDYTESFIKMAGDRFNDFDNCHFIQGDFNNLIKVLKDNGEYRRYNNIFINGVLMYINDRDIGVCLNALNEVLSTNGIIYLKESVGLGQRLTLQNYYSEELRAQYSVIYRTVEQYSKLIYEYLNSMSVYACGPTFTDYIDYNLETSNWFWIIKKRG